MDATLVLEHPEGRAVVAGLASGRKLVSVELTDGSAYVSKAAFETNYSVDLIKAILDLRGPAQLGYSVRRAETSNLAEALRHYIHAYVDEYALRDKRMLDFGCGSGSSTVALAELCPRTQIVAVDLEPGNISVARARAEHHGAENVTFEVSPGPIELPPEIGTFDFICLSAVYEHLLPAERPVIMRKLWEVLRPGGILFLNQTPHRYYPIETHTTGLPFLNYLPDRLEHIAARRFSRRVDRDATWEDLLRGGIRGATEHEIVDHLASSEVDAATLLRPCLLGLQSHVDLWYSLSMAERPRWFKRPLRRVLTLISAVSRSSFVPDLNLAIRKSCVGRELKAG